LNYEDKPELPDMPMTSDLATFRAELASMQLSQRVSVDKQMSILKSMRDTDGKLEAALEHISADLQDVRNSLRDRRCFLEEVHDNFLYRAVVPVGERRRTYGSIADFPVQFFVNLQVAAKLHRQRSNQSRPHFNICEVGFGPGYSAIMFLAGTSEDCRRPSLGGGMLYEFSHECENSVHYSHDCKVSKQFILDTFGKDRVDFRFGDSGFTIPSFANSLQNKTADFCDVIHIDGEHSTVGLERDIQFMKWLAGRETIWLFDDLNMDKLRVAVDSAVSSGILKLDSNYTIFGVGESQWAFDWKTAIKKDLDSGKFHAPYKMFAVYVSGKNIDKDGAK